MTDTVIHVRNLGKQYRIGGVRKPYRTIREAFIDAARAPFRKFTQPIGGDTTFWALKDVNFDINRGEVVGIIGRNGAGKSTLLKILSRITEPTEGEVEILGRVGSLLEVGTGFHPELTGRENIFLNGAILGMKRAEIARRFYEIVAFAETEKFLDTPVKFYSSGMYTRLAFAVAAHLEPEILVVDEVLSVGDAEFQKKCLGKMGEVAKGGRTVLFVSHNIATVMALCNECIFLDHGSVMKRGRTSEVVKAYTSQGITGTTALRERAIRKPLQIIGCDFQAMDGTTRGNFEASEAIITRIILASQRSFSGVEVSLRIVNASAQPVFTTNLSDTRDSLAALTPGIHTYFVKIPGNLLAPGEFTVTVGVHAPNIEVFDYLDNVARFEIEETGTTMSKYAGKNYGSIIVTIDWNSSHHNSDDPSSLLNRATLDL